MRRMRLIITGQVQGVGFRPFIYRLAHERHTGFVLNSPEGVVIEVQGNGVEDFAARVRAELPPLARIVTLDEEDVPAVDHETSFEIRMSTAGEGHSVLISPDTATCVDCLAEMNDPSDRRFLYPFTNCTNCGPRWTITRSIPYDRPFTSMACFPMCPECGAEYGDPLDRRFHAQPNACPVCGPEVWAMDPEGNRLEHEDPLHALARELAEGKVCAVKGLGGFHLACDATSESAVATLRKRKHRPDKPLAIMVPDLEAARATALVSNAEEEQLAGTVRPIVLLRKTNGDGALAPSVAPDTDYIGIMLPYTPLHHVLMRHFSELKGDGPAALVMTSGNMGGEPICLGNREALSRLSGIADFFLLHNRDILIRCDDSVMRINPSTDAPLHMRRARGFTPSPVFLSRSGPSVLGLGPELKCTLCVTKGDQAFLSQHIGDMENLETARFHGEILDHLTKVLQTEPESAVRDLHPGYMTSALAEDPDGWVGSRNLPVKQLQHHFAHAHAVLAENRHQGPALVLALDGTGYGEDHTVWGGELLFVNTESLEHKRMAKFSSMLLPGGDAAVREPWRIARAMLHQIGRDEPENAPWLEEYGAAAKFLPQLIAKGVNCPSTSSCGRLFDAVSAMLGLRTAVTYEGQAAIVLERMQDLSETRPYACPVRVPEPLGGVVPDVEAELDVHVLFNELCRDADAGTPIPAVARRFHLGLVNGLADLAARFAKSTGVRVVGLSGGVMQNLTLAEELPRALEARGMSVLVHTLVPPNDACISLGQAAWGMLSMR